MSAETTTRIAVYLDRVEKIERAGVMGIKETTDRLASLQLLNETFTLIRRDPPQAYIRLMKGALGQPSSAKTTYINRIALLSRLAGYALMYAMQSDEVFQRIMSINERPTDTGVTA